MFTIYEYAYKGNKQDKEKMASECPLHARLCTSLLYLCQHESWPSLINAYNISENILGYLFLFLSSQKFCKLNIFIYSLHIKAQYPDTQLPKCILHTVYSTRCILHTVNEQNSQDPSSEKILFSFYSTMLALIFIIWISLIAIRNRNCTNPVWTRWSLYFKN